jgi:hypothetical protein
MAMARPDFAASAEGAEHGSAGLTAEDSVPYEVVVATIDALGGPRPAPHCSLSSSFLHARAEAVMPREAGHR